MWQAGFWADGFWADGFWRLISAAGGLGGGHDFLDPEWHKKRVSPKTRRIIQRIARQATSSAQEYAPNEQERDLTSLFVPRLSEALEREQIAWQRFYADLLRQQTNDQITAQIRLQFQMLGIYEQIRSDEEDEQSIMLLMFDL